MLGPVCVIFCIAAVLGSDPDAVEFLPLRSVYGNSKPLPVAGNPGERLLLTPYLLRGHISEARAKAQVHSPELLSHQVPSYSGFFTVNERHNSNLWFWYFPAERNQSAAPVLLWLQGGPGSSSLYGLFTELGPFIVAEDDSSLILNPYSWHKDYHLIFIDNPVGTGYSFTDSTAGLATEMTQVGEELYSALIQFFTLFHELQSHKFYITGESYAGKHIPAIGHAIHRHNPTAPLKINLHGLIIGNAFTDPYTILNYSEYLHQLGFIDTQTRDTIKSYEDSGRRNIDNGQLTQAWRDWNNALSTFMSKASFPNVYNILYQNELVVGGDYEKFIQQEEVRRGLHVGDAVFGDNNQVYYTMVPDFMTSVKPWVEELANASLPIVFFSGQFDVICATPTTVHLLETARFKGSEQYRTAPKRAWYVGEELAGYFKRAGSVTEVIVRKAGHMVPTDQPVFALDMLSRIIHENYP